MKNIVKLMGIAAILMALVIIGCPNNGVREPDPPATPTAVPSGGTYTSVQSVTLTSTDGASIYYTLDGANPTAASTLYTAPISISQSVTLKAIAVKDGVSSTVLTAVYTIGTPLPVAATPTANPGAGTYSSVQSVVLGTTTTGASIYYTLDGTDPTAASTLYTAPLSINQSVTLKAIAVMPGFLDSGIFTAVYTINLQEVNASIVSLVQHETVTEASQFTYAHILEMVREAIDFAGGLEGIVKAGDTVVLKPNVVTSYYGWATSSPLPQLVNGIYTDWRVIQAVAEIVREIVGPYNPVTGAGRIRLMEGSSNGNASGHAGNTGYNLTNLTHVNEIIWLENEGTWVGAGIGTGAQADYVTQISLPQWFYTSSNNSYYSNDGKYWVNTKMLEADVLICIPVLKTHNAAAGITGSIKNIGIGAAPPRVYGMSSNNVGRNNMVSHSTMDIHDWIADYYSTMPADFTVMDGLQGLANGPAGQANQAALTADQQNFRLILASRDALALDYVAASIQNWDPNGYIPYNAGNNSGGTYLSRLASRGQVYARGEIGNANPRMIPLRGYPRDIVVLGNRMVDNVRKDVAGSVSNNGRRLTSADKTLPTVAVNSAVFSGDNLNLALTVSSGTDNNVVKVDVYVDGAYRGSANSNLANVSIDATGLAAGSRTIEVRAYTRYLFSAVATTTAVR